jgi:hypothetical protein
MSKVAEACPNIPKLIITPVVSRIVPVNGSLPYKPPALDQPQGIWLYAFPVLR